MKGKLCLWSAARWVLVLDVRLPHDSVRLMGNVNSPGDVPIATTGIGKKRLRGGISSAPALVLDGVSFVPNLHIQHRKSHFISALYFFFGIFI